MKAYQILYGLRDLLCLFSFSIPRFFAFRDDPKLEAHLLKFLKRFFEHGEVNKATAYDERTPLRQFHPELIDYRIKNPSVCEEDIRIFRAFTSEDSLIIDIGANWGYSVLDIWEVGARSKILSFEPVVFFRPLLSRIAQLYPERYAYSMIGLSSETGRLNFVAPVIHDIPLYALTSANQTPNLIVLARNIFDHINAHLHNLKTIKLKMLSFSSQVDTLDNQLALFSSRMNFSDLVAIKLDVEGLEYQVLRGAYKVLSKYRPLLMVEGGNRWPGIADYMHGLGYQFAEREGDALVLKVGQGENINGFFVHNEKLESYRELGILV